MGKSETDFYLATKSTSSKEEFRLLCKDRVSQNCFLTRCARRKEEEGRSLDNAN